MHVLPSMFQCLVFMNTGQIEAISVTGRAHCQRQVAFFYICRWKRDEKNEIVKHEKSGKQILQFISIQRGDCNMWAIPGVRAYTYIVGCFNTGLYYNNVGYVLAQVMSVVFCQQMLQSILIKYTILD